MITGAGFVVIIAVLVSVPLSTDVAGSICNLFVQNENCCSMADFFGKETFMLFVINLNYIKK